MNTNSKHHIDNLIDSGQSSLENDSKVETVLKSATSGCSDATGDGNAIDRQDKTISNIMNLSTKSKFSNDEDVSVPLNLSVKKAATPSSSSNSNSFEGSKLPSKLIVNNLVNSNRPVLSHPLLHQLQQHQQQQQQPSLTPPIIPQQKKRGRKPKALQNNNDSAHHHFLNFADIASVANNFLSPNLTGQSTHTSTPNNAIPETKPRKRGRPPTLSPPHNAMQSLAAHASNLGKANTSGAFTPAYPFNLFNTPDVLSSFPGLNALTAAAAAAAAATGNPFSNSHNPFNLFNKLNAKEINNFNLNLMNTNLFNLKNQQSQENDFVNNKPHKPERKAKEEPNSNSQPSKNSENSTSKGSFAHKPHPNEKQLRIPLNHG